MRNTTMKITFILLVLFVLTGVNVFAQSETPVEIAFDENSGRIDLITGKKLPDYKYVKRGSFQFFLDRLDSPDDFFNFYHDGINKGYPRNYDYIEKIEPQYDMWITIYKNGGRNSPRIHHKAVSFIPLSLEDKKPERRVYVLMNDLELIKWGKEPE